MRRVRYWKSTGEDGSVMAHHHARDAGVLPWAIGMKKTLVYFRGRTSQ